ncbi:hypothetical protein H5410_056704 [Solanum commersonii]|uniref:Uncharacterized protein n=1 Tax=Solanum commersonii TaxID=4109 RepID=A0A9J5WM31_SOLCO|nr:hypothetical protein H5410_056704 [Solanum commersonii]
MDNEIQKLKTNEDNLNSKVSTSQQHDYKNVELSRSEDFKNPELRGTSKQVSEKQHKNTNLNQLFEKPFTPRMSRNTLTMEPQTSTYADSLQNEKKLYNHHQRKILYEEIKPPIQVIKIGLTKDMIIPEDIGQQEEIRKIEIPSFYANKRIIGISTIIQELANNYLNKNAILSYYSRDQLMIYSNSRELRKANMDEKKRPTTRALKVGFISPELLSIYCKLIGHKYPDHLCTKCNGEDNVIPYV